MLFAVAMVMGLGYGTRVDASCGDYLHTKHSQPAKQSVEESEADSPVQQQPCHGENCQEQKLPVAPVPVPVTLVSPAPEKAVTSPAPSRGAESATGFSDAAIGSSRRGYPSGVDRPPQFTEANPV